MVERAQQIRQILDHINRIETELTLLRQLVGQLANNNEEGDQDLILVDAELVIPQETVAQSLTRREIRQEARWRAQNWALRERQERSEREALEHLAQAAREERD